VTRFLLDTHAVIAMLKDRGGPVASRLRRLDRGDVTLSSVVYYELAFGAFKSEFPQKNLATLTSLPF
jgi:tRNA(fMet)-specific endonuclease VapC